jgi:hypothetical protein
MDQRKKEMKMFRWLKNRFRTWLILAVYQPGEYEGPAKLELFGRDSHVGWLRSCGTLISMLTTDGQALRFDARAQFRLTPVTWQALVEETLKVKLANETNEHFHEQCAKNLRNDLRKEEARSNELRTALEYALEGLKSETPQKTIIEAISRTLKEDETENGIIPF